MSLAMSLPLLPLQLVASVVQMVPASWRLGEASLLHQAGRGISAGDSLGQVERQSRRIQCRRETAARVWRCCCCRSGRAPLDSVACPLPLWACLSTCLMSCRAQSGKSYSIEARKRASQKERQTETGADCSNGRDLLHFFPFCL